MHILEGGGGGDVSLKPICNFIGEMRKEGMDHGRNGIASVHLIF